MKNFNAHLSEGKTLEDILSKKDDKVFKKKKKEKSEKSYPKRYKDVKLALRKIHNTAEKGALATSLENYINENISIADNDFKKGLESAIIYLNNHGKEHTNKVIVKISEILQYFPPDRGLTPYEIFILLCAIQIHDTGNRFGRANHEQVIGPIFDEECSKILPNKFERDLITKIAMVHSGQIFGNNDIIKYLSEVSKMHNFSVRERLLASLLRFGDELADDNSRADRYGIEINKIPKHSKIFHYYSHSLHTVKISHNKENNEFVLELVYNFDTDIAREKFFRENTEKYLLDEIYDRTIKMEKERRYCMRYLRPYFYLSKISVNIRITDKNYAMNFKEINYILEEEGYPDVEILIKNRLSGDELVRIFESKNEGK
jgi:hypothetical protein